MERRRTSISCITLSVSFSPPPLLSPPRSPSFQFLTHQFLKKGVGYITYGLLKLNYLLLGLFNKKKSTSFVYLNLFNNSASSGKFDNRYVFLSPCLSR